MAQRAFKLQRGGSTVKGAHPEKPPTEVSACVATMHCPSSLIADGPTANWVGPETLVGLWVEGREADTLADSGSQVNTVTPGYVHQHEFPELPLCDLVNPPSTWLG